VREPAPRRRLRRACRPARRSLQDLQQPSLTAAQCGGPAALAGLLE
jgi:hypothetical protein